MSENEREQLIDEALVLHVKDYQTADKLVVCFTKKHGKLRFIAYGARYVNNDIRVDCSSPQTVHGRP